METRKPKAQITPLLPNDVLARVERLRLVPRKRFTNRSRGEHVAQGAGASIEFKDFRDYTPGDDMRFVDWNIFARLHRPYLKLFHQEEEMHVVLLVDASSSMMFENKLERARQLGAAFGVMGLMAVERVSVHAFNQRGQRVTRMPATTGRKSMQRLFRFIESIEGGGDATLEVGIDEMLKQHRGRGMVIVLSDFLTTGDLRRGFNLLYSAGLEMFGVQILSPTEIEPEVNSDLRLVDSETGITLDVSSGGDIIALYQQYFEAYQRHLESMCQSRSGRMITVNAKLPLDQVLFDALRRRGWVR